MVSQVDTSKWFELTEDSDTDDDLHHSHYKSLKHPDLIHPLDDFSKQHKADDPSLSQYSLQLSRLSSDGCNASTKLGELNDPALSQYSLGQSQLSALEKTTNKPTYQSIMDSSDRKKVDVESLHLQFQTLLADDSQEGDSTQLSSASDQQGSTTDDPWKSATETSDGPSLSEYPLEGFKLSSEDVGQTVTEESSGCEEALHTAISEVSKDFITGNLSSYPLQSGDSDLSSDDQKVLQKHLGGKYPETAVGMSDSDWNVTESDTNVSPRLERTKVESSLSTVSSFSPPLSSTVLTNSTVSGKETQGLSIIQEASVENTISFKELPSDVSVSRGSFLGRDHEKNLDSLRTIYSSSVSSTDSAKHIQDLSEKRKDNQERPTVPGEEIMKSGRNCENIELTPNSVLKDITKTSNASVSEPGAGDSSGRSGHTISHTTNSIYRDSLAGSSASSLSNSSETRLPFYPDLYPSNAQLAMKSQEILDRTLSRLNLKGSFEGRYSFPLTNTGSGLDDYKRHSIGRLERSPYSMQHFKQSRHDELVRSLSGSTQSYHSDDFTRSTKSLSSDSSQSAASDEVAKLMARSGSSAETTMSRGDDPSPIETKVVKETVVSAAQVTDRSQISQGSRQSVDSSHSVTEDISSRVNSVLAETAYIDKYSSPPPAANENRNTNHGSGHPSSSKPIISQVSPSDYPLPPPPVTEPQLPTPEQPLPPPPQQTDAENPASLDYRRLQQDLQEIQNSLQKNLDFDSGNDSVQSSDVERDKMTRTPVGSETGSEIIPSTTTTPDRSRRLMWDYGADIACAGGQPGRFTSRDTDATDTDNSDSNHGSYLNQNQIAHNASRRHPYNSEGEETHTSASSLTRKDSVRAPGRDDEHHSSGSNTPTRRNIDEVITSFRAQRSMIEYQYLRGMANQVSHILSQQDPEKQAHGILDEVNTAEQELMTRLANRPPVDSSFTDTSANVSNRSLLISDSDVRRKLEMSGLSSPDRSRSFGNASFMEFSTPRKIAGPFTAFSNAKTFLSSQLEEMSNKTFNHSIELRTPLRSVVDCYPLYGFTKSTDKTDGGRVSSSRSDDGLPESAQTRNGRGQPEGISPEESASQRRLSPDLIPSVESTQSVTDRRIASSPGRNFSEGDLTSDLGQSQPGERYQTDVSGEREDNRSSPSASSPADLSQYRDKLRPYRPAGSRDLYYTESDTGSAADSVTTMESTHTGSDDAVPPYFPPHVLGSRHDGPSQPVIPRKHQSQGMQLEQALSTIEEKSVTDDRERTSIESMRSGPDEIHSRESVSGRDMRAERALDGVRPRSPRDTISKLDARMELDAESGIGSRSNINTTGDTDTRERRSQGRPTENRSEDHIDQGFRSHRLENDETLRAARRVLEDLDGRKENGSQGQIEGSGRSRPDFDLARTSSGNKLDSDRKLGSYTESHSSQHLDNGSAQNVNIGSILHSDGRTSREYDSQSHEARPHDALDIRLDQNLNRRSGQTLEIRSGQTMDTRSRHTATRSGQTLDSISGHNLITDKSEGSRPEQDVDRQSSGQNLTKQDPFESRLRSRSDGDLITKHRESSSPVCEGRFPEPSPQQSPIHHYSTLRESQIHTDPRHSTAIDSSSTEPRRSGSREKHKNGGHQREGEGQITEVDRDPVLSNGKDGRPRSSDRKDSRQRMEQNRKARRGQIDASSSEDDSNRAIDRAPVSRPAQLLREALEQELDPGVPANINMLWQRFQELNPTDSDTSLNTTRMEKLAHLLRNPAKHLVTSYFEDRESDRRVSEEKAAKERARRREERRSQKLRNASESESNGSYTEVIENPRVKTNSSSVKKLSKKNSKSDRTQDSENLYSIPEDISFDQRRSKKASDLIDPNMEKLREKIERQKEKIERERRKELKRMEKLVKLESLLSAKKKGKISESTLLDQLEYISTTSAPTDSTEEITESTLTVSGANSETLTDDTTTAKDSSLEMQMAKYAKSMDSRLQNELDKSQQETAHSKQVDFMENRSRKAEKVRMNEKLKEQTKGKSYKNKRFSNEEESLYDYREVDIQIVDKPQNRGSSPNSNKQERSTSRRRMRDAATNYPSPAGGSPQSQHKSKQRRTKSEAIQTTPHLHQNVYKSRSPSPKHSRNVEPGAPFTMREKANRSRSPPYSRQFTPESMENQQPKRKQKKLPASPKGIAWYVEVKDPRPWRQPLKERQAYAVRQAWVPDSKSQWQTADPRDVNEDDGGLETRFVVDKQDKEDVAPKLIDENYTSKKTPSLQDAFNVKMQDFISRSRERQKRMALAAEHRHMQEALRREREKIFADKRKQEANPNAHPYSENLLHPKKRVFTRQEQKEMTKKTYNRLPEVIKREEDRKRENEYKLNRLRAKVFTKRVQRHVLIKAGSY